MSSNLYDRPGPTVKPSVSLLPPSSLQISGDSAALLCLLSSYSPQGAQVSWTLDGSEVTDGVVTSAESERDGRYSRSSVLTLSKTRWEEVDHWSQSEALSVSAASLFSADLWRLSRTALSAQLLLSTGGWTLDGSEVTEGVQTSAESEQEGRYSRSSVLSLSKAAWENAERFVCRVTHDGDDQQASFLKSSEC
ncbi:hypothetical protein Q8A67_000024 [Cirrhinus molitorella]|uniref:Ig-like domain-containing protein n=1 Tax=Cirrhinus molitorella TaxID=172907 RepID=A0AA88QIU1_9TELE|nr:hypothetical protein Q8A67_000024 [Cirrhinus molitorella]